MAGEPNVRVVHIFNGHWLSDAPRRDFFKTIYERMLFKFWFEDFDDAKLFNQKHFQTHSNDDFQFRLNGKSKFYFIPIER